MKGLHIEVYIFSQPVNKDFLNDALVFPQQTLLPQLQAWRHCYHQRADHRTGICKLGPALLMSIAAFQRRLFWYEKPTTVLVFISKSF